MLVLGFTLEPVCTVHVFCFVVATIDVHSFRVQPYKEGQKWTIGTLQNLHLKAKAVRMTSIDHEPRSTRSPFISRQCLSVGYPVREKRCRTS